MFSTFWDVDTAHGSTTRSMQILNVLFTLYCERGNWKNCVCVCVCVGDLIIKAPGSREIGGSDSGLDYLRVESNLILSYPS